MKIYCFLDYNVGTAKLLAFVAHRIVDRSYDEFFALFAFNMLAAYNAYD